ncbi:AMP-binding protein [Kibdelosporangium aridum]|uniref:AMP-binding protein n=1 Tax=Kibdelosporangium aridum TaxID=2030 RepID=UPI00055ED672|nr:AMP-binding protein [Kibdelosporangium aridum]
MLRLRGEHARAVAGPRLLSRASDRLSSWLAAHGVHKGDPVLLMLGNQVELWEAMLAIMKRGAVPVGVAS